MDKTPHKMNYDLDVVKTIELKSAISDGMNEKKAAEMKGIWVKLNPEMFAFVEDANTTIVKITDGKVGCGCDDFNKATTDRLCKLKKPPAVSIQSPDYRLLRAYMFETGWSAGEDRWVYPSPDAPTEPEDAPELNDETSKGTEMVHYECPKCGDIVDIESGKLQDWKLNHMDVCPGTKKPTNTVTHEETQVRSKQEPTEIPSKKTPGKQAVVKDSLTTDAKTAQVAKPQAVPKTIAEAMCNMQKTELFAITDSDNPFFKSKYADLASIWSAIRKPLTDNGLAVIQTTEPYSGGITVITTLLHVSGESYSTELSAKADKQTIQGLGSLITYLRRYSLAALVGVASADDDGEAASGREHNKR